MAATSTITASRTNTFTEARVRYVMAKIHDDLIVMAACNLLTYERANKWQDDLSAVLLLEAVELFQIKLARPDGAPAAVTYRLSDDGSLAEDSASGGINWYGQPKGTTANIVVRLRDGRKKEAALAELERRGWSFNGSVLEDEGVRDRAYSVSGYGFTRNKIGKVQ